MCERVCSADPPACQQTCSCHLVVCAAGLVVHIGVFVLAACKHTCRLPNQGFAGSRRAAWCVPCCCCSCNSLCSGSGGCMNNLLSPSTNKCVHKYHPQHACLHCVFGCAAFCQQPASSRCLCGFVSNTIRGFALHCCVSAFYSLGGFGCGLFR